MGMITIFYRKNFCDKGYRPIIRQPVKSDSPVVRQSDSPTD